MEPSRKVSTKSGRALVLRPLKASDLDAVLDFANGIVRERRTNREIGIVSLDRHLTRAKEREFLDRLAEGARKRRVVSVGAFDGKTLAGHCDVTGRSLAEERHTGVLGIVIAEPYRGDGLGELMVREALRRARAFGITLVELTAFENNARARALYRKVGFKEVGIVPGKILRDGRLLDEVVMYVSLPEE